MPSARICADRRSVADFLAKLNSHAQLALSSLKDFGQLTIVGIHPNGKSPKYDRFVLGSIVAQTDYAISLSEDGYNAYIEPRTVRSNVVGRGKQADTKYVFALVVDSDSDKNKPANYSVHPSFAVETSPGNQHAWFFLSHAIQVQEAVALGAGLRAVVGGDSATGVPTQPYRIPGTPNYISETKSRRGRVDSATRIISLSGPTYNPEEIRRAFTPELSNKIENFLSRRKSYTAERPELASPKKLPSLRLASRGEAARARVTALVSIRGADRSAQFQSAVLAAVAAGMTLEDLEREMRAYPSGCAEKYLVPKDRLRREIKRSWSKAEKRLLDGSKCIVDHENLPEALSVEHARNALVEAFEKFDSTMKLYNPESSPPPVHALKITTGVGKTSAAIDFVQRLVLDAKKFKKRLKIVYSVPTLKLADELRRRFSQKKLAARVFRGREAVDPDVPSRLMCLDIEAIKLAALANNPIARACCRDLGIGGQTLTCGHLANCAYQRQLGESPDVWIVTHPVLFQPNAIFLEADILIIDEKFWQHGIERQRLKVEDLIRPPRFSFLHQAEFRRALDTFQKIADALSKQSVPGPVKRSTFLDCHLSQNEVELARQFEANVAMQTSMWPGMHVEERRLAARQKRNTKAIDALLAETCNLLATTLSDEAGRLELSLHDDATLSVEIRRVRPIKIHAPTLILDATLPDREILANFFPHVEIADDIRASMPNVRVRQILGAPVAARKLDASNEGPKTNLEDMRRYILLRYVELGRKPILVVAQKAVAQWLRASGLPKDVAFEHFGALEGLDVYGSVRGLIIVGRTLPSPSSIEALAGALTGAQPVRSENWYNKTVRLIETQIGDRVLVDADIHPDGLAEAIRRSICEDAIDQAIGRGRGVNRTHECPLCIDIVSDVVTSVPVDEVKSWSPPDELVEFMSDGVVLKSPGDLFKLRPLQWPSEGATRQWISRRSREAGHTVTETYMKFSIDTGHAVQPFRYQHAGARQRWRDGAYDPELIEDPRAWLEDRLGVQIVGFEVLAGPPELATAPS